MEQEVDSGFRSVCSTCLSSDRNLISLSGLTQVYQIFQLLMFDFAADRFGDQLSKVEHLVCWECLALMRRFLRFKRQVHNAQEHLHMLAVSGSAESMDHTYMSQSLSVLEMVTKVEYDKIYFDYVPDEPWPTTLITINQSDDVKNEQYDSVVQAVREAVNLDIDHHIIEVPQIMIESPVTGVMSHLVIDRNNMISNDETYGHVKGELADLSGNIEIPKVENAITCSTEVKEVDDKKTGYITEYMTENDMLAFREQEQQKVKYATSNYKCELCIIGFYTQNQVKDHFLSAHRAQPNTEACRICYVYVPEAKLNSHVESHYIRHICRLCGHTETSVKFMKHHVRSHMVKVHSNAVIKIDGTEPAVKKKKKDTKSANNGPHKPGDLRKLLSKTTIEGYQCLECDMFFKNSRARKNHVARFHREGLQCDHCKKRFVNRTTLATHLRLHEGPLPRDKCPICHKMVRVIQLKYHIKRHQNKSRYECTDCNKIFSHLATYQAHLKYSRAHASDQVFKFPCPMCNKGYPTKEAMQDHFNYQHLGKTSHKCPVCDKPIASRANVEKHMMRVHGEKKDKPRNHVCQQCGKAFTDRKALTQHEVIHSCDRPLSCDICQQTFKQKASLYTHRKRVHKVYPAKRVVEFMETKSEGT